MRFPPPDVIASWPRPNHVNPETRGPALIIVVLILLSVVFVCLGLRLYVRLRIINKSEWDDWLMVPAAAFGAGVTTCVLLAYARFGWDIHVWDLTLDQMIAGRQVSFAAQALFILGTCTAKLSILISYLRLAPANSWFRRMTFAGIVYVTLVTVTFFTFLWTQCIPVSSYWNFANNQRDCLTEGPAIIAHASMTASADALVWMLPLPSLYRAKLPLGQRLALIVLFSFGLIVVFSACIRIYWLHWVLEETYDVTWESLEMWLWTAVEIQLGIICGCVPWLRSLFNFWRSRRTVTDITDRSYSYGKSKCCGVQHTFSDTRHTATAVAITTASKGGAVVSTSSVENEPDGLREKQEDWVDLENGPCPDPKTVGVAL